ncbi:MAG: ribulose-phosphate 3-epimerase [Oscillospiraceae bacterium]|jgi:ribulose-phosphate 3-epimerase|nr:ribulose-phosphate 3-epimerase [Oscillospiraceae bacterium]
MIKISPSVLACDFSRLGEEVRAMEKAGADMIHLDIMDGHFVPNISFGPPVVASLRRVSDMFFDTHLMLTHPLSYIDGFAAAGSNRITFHLESENDAGAVIDRIEVNGAEPGIVIKPATPAQAVFPYLHRVKMVLVMTVEPGFGGQRFMADMCPKIAALRDEVTKRGLDVDIEVDGGIDAGTAVVAAKAGANVLVAGSSLFGSGDYMAAVAAMRDRARQALYQG